MTDHTRINGGGRWWRILAWGGAATLLLAPLIAMQFGDEVRWTVFDFLVAGVMLAVPLGVLELTLRATGSLAYRASVAVALGTALLMTWINLAVGIIGNENNPLNLMFFGVIAVGIVGAFVAHFRPRGMAVAMVVTALAQAAAAVVALIGEHSTVPLISAFALMWLLSAWLFRKAADQPSSDRVSGP